MRLLCVVIALVIACEAERELGDNGLYLLNNVPANILNPSLLKEPTGVPTEEGEEEDIGVVPPKLDDRLQMSPVFEKLNFIGREMSEKKKWINRLYNMDAFIISMQSQDEFRKVAHSKELCNSPETLYDGGVRTVYFEHEPNVPYEMPCFSCHSWVHRFGFLTDFHINADSNDNRELVYEWKWKSMWDILDANLNKYQMKGRGILQRARPIDIDSGGLEYPLELDAFDDGRLLVTPTEETEEDWNSISARCSIMLDGEAKLMDTVISSTYITDNNSSESDFSKYSNARFKIEQFEMEHPTKKKEMKEMPEMNLKYFLSWRDWGCCSACCCDRRECGENFAVAEENCKQMHSFRKRLGYMSIAKIDHMQPIMGTTDSANISKETIQKLEYLLSSQPYVQFGVPLYSSVISMEMREELTEALSVERQSSSLGMFFDIEDCKDLPEKKSCRELKQCQTREKERLYNYDTKIHNGESGVAIEDFDESCRKIPFEEFLVEEVQSEVLVVLGGNYRIVINEARFGKLTKIKWSHASNLGAKIHAYDNRRECKDQKLVVAPNEKDVIIIDVGEKFDDTALIGELMAPGNKGSAKFIRVNFAFSSRLKTAKSRQVTQWLLVSAGSFVFLCVAVFTLHMMNLHQARKRIAEKNAPVEVKEKVKEVKEVKAAVESMMDIDACRANVVLYNFVERNK